MGSSTPATTTTSSSSQPWSQATPLLQSLISQYGGLNTSVTPGQSTALSNLNSSAAGIPNFGDAASGGVNQLFNSSTAPQVGMLNSGYDTLNKNIGSTADGSQLNPYSTPGFSDALGTMTNDITNQVKGVYAGSGRDPSGAGSFAQSLGRGLTQGEAPVIASQYNQNKQNQLNSAGTLYNASGTTAGNITGQNQVPLTNILSGLQGAGMIPGLYTSSAATQLGAANATQQQPFSNLQSLLTPAMGLGALGQQTSGTATQTPANNPLNNWLGGIFSGAGLLGGLGQAGGSAGISGLFPSDKRLKENIRVEGKMPSGLPIKSYNMKHDPFKQRQVGFIAQDLMKKHPDAVHQIGRYKAVDYGRAMQLGMIQTKEAA